MDGVVFSGLQQEDVRFLTIQTVAAIVLTPVTDIDAPAKNNHVLTLLYILTQRGHKVTNGYYNEVYYVVTILLSDERAGVFNGHIENIFTLDFLSSRYC